MSEPKPKEITEAELLAMGYKLAHTRKKEGNKVVEPSKPKSTSAYVMGWPSEKGGWEEWDKNRPK